MPARSRTRSKPSRSKPKSNPAPAAAAATSKVDPPAWQTDYWTAFGGLRLYSFEAFATARHDLLTASRSESDRARIKQIHDRCVNEDVTRLCANGPVPIENPAILRESLCRPALEHLADVAHWHHLLDWRGPDGAYGWPAPKKQLYHHVAIVRVIFDLLRYMPGEGKPVRPTGPLSIEDAIAAIEEVHEWCSIWVPPKQSGPRALFKRDHQFLAWYEASDAPTFHSQAEIAKKWNDELTSSERNSICPGAGKVSSREVVKKAVKLARQEREAGKA